MLTPDSMNTAHGRTRRALFLLRRVYAIVDDTDRTLLCERSAHKDSRQRTREHAAIAGRAQGKDRQGRAARLRLADGRITSQHRAGTRPDSTRTDVPAPGAPPSGLPNEV